MVKPYDPTTGRKPSVAQLRQAARDEVGCEKVRIMGPPCLDYCAFFADADERAARGEEQKRCTSCKRYRWADEAAVCRDFTTEEA